MRLQMLLAAATSFALCIAAASAQEKPKVDAPKDSSSGQTAQKSANPSKAGPAHEVLAQRSGTWKMLYRVYANPGNPPIELPATGEFKMIFGGRFLRQEMAGEGTWQGTSGLGIEGYDNLNQKYFFNWIDSNSTGTITLTGTADDSGKTITYTGQLDDASTQTKGIKVRAVVHIVSKDEHTFEFYMTRPGSQEVRPFDITYTRK